jgi:hypothetical protein
MVSILEINIIFEFITPKTPKYIVSI